MIRAIGLSALLVVLFAPNAAHARDLLSAGNPPTRIVKAAFQPRPHAAPFTTLPDGPGYVCSISGLGRTSTCIVRSAAERRAMVRTLASR